MTGAVDSETVTLRVLPAGSDDFASQATLTAEQARFHSPFLDRADTAILACGTCECWRPFMRARAFPPMLLLLTLLGLPHLSWRSAHAWRRCYVGTGSSRKAFWLLPVQVVYDARAGRLTLHQLAHRLHCPNTLLLAW